VHTEAELDRALAAGADVVGVNQRDLHTFQVDRDRARRLAEQMPTGIVKVAESGVRSNADVAQLVAGGYDAVLIGETLVRAADPAAALRDLLSAAA
jgi:indole-3-glycerol phosphate synthase